MRRQTSYFNLRNSPQQTVPVKIYRIGDFEIIMEALDYANVLRRDGIRCAKTVVNKKPAFPIGRLLVGMKKHSDPIPPHERRLIDL